VCAEQFGGWTLACSVPAAGVLSYLLAKPLLVALCKANGTTGRSTGFTAFCYLHNVALCLFSLVTCIRSVSLVADSYQRLGWYDTYCATETSTLMSDGLSFYTTLFYLSKCALRSRRIYTLAP
jgi:hypothetical protein